MLLAVGDHLGKFPSEVGGLPPSELAILGAWYQERRRREEWRWGILFNLLEKLGGGEGREPEDWFPDLKPDEEDAPVTPFMTDPTQIRDTFAAWAAAVGTVVKKDV